ncbi:DNA cytosine methyltransferase [Neorhizobium sp. AL 9.2.2]|uniref:DNA cytosine methyltransferase n=1 Tax=Neorhizobium sp. AL 9.2.2 TaxID=2712894 RepID=UPI0015716770|nr:DNA cytosine methyltransferase [Neorhizobium sp. AL 9.2.2]NSY17235.1 DNA cytosine methyltransferase [Neorhizobium sp. AL 9.2.2]
MSAYYNEIDPYAAQWLRNLIAAGHIAPGDVDERSIVDVHADDLKAYTQCHFFAGIGGWSYAARLAGYPDDRELWTGSCPCQPFSVAGKGEGQSDDRHLWPEQFRLIQARRPIVWVGEQVAAAVGKHWLDGVQSDLERIGYASRAAIIPACAVDAPHRRDRAWVVANTYGERCNSRRSGTECEERAGAWSNSGDSNALANSGSAGLNTGRRPCQERQRETELHVADSDIPLADSHFVGAGEERQQRSGQLSGPGSNSRSGAWDGSVWATSAGKARRIEPGIRLLAHGVPARVGKLRAYGNAIVPQVAAEVIGAYLDMERAAA